MLIYIYSVDIFRTLTLGNAAFLFDHMTILYVPQ